MKLLIVLAFIGVAVSMPISESTRSPHDLTGDLDESINCNCTKTDTHTRKKRSDELASGNQEAQGNAVTVAEEEGGFWSSIWSFFCSIGQGVADAWNWIFGSNKIAPPNEQLAIENGTSVVELNPVVISSNGTDVLEGSGELPEGSGQEEGSGEDDFVQAILSNAS